MLYSHTLCIFVSRARVRAQSARARTYARYGPDEDEPDGAEDYDDGDEDEEEDEHDAKQKK